MIAKTNDISIHCNLYISFWANILLTRLDLNFIFSIEVVIIVEDNFDSCGYIDNSFHFSNSYYIMIIGKKILKFKSINFINILPNQKYFHVFINLIFVKIAIIAWLHFVI